jgi:hypothetical protein
MFSSAFNKKNIPAFATLAFCFFVLLWLAFKNEYPQGGADNYWHYWFSRYAFEYPQFFLHHWGKPIFILLSAPFSQFGFLGMKLFNITCGILSAWVCWRFCRDIGFSNSALVILILIFCPAYFTELPTALTEPLFGLLLISSSYLFFRSNFFWGATVASLLLFSRSEGMFIVVYFSAYLLIVRQWKYIPLLATAFIIYAFAGLFAGHNFFWYFTENPYGYQSQYGSGAWNHFFKLESEIFGEPHVALLLSGIIILTILLFRNREYNFLKSQSINAKVALLVFAPALLFFFFHVFAWTFGKFGSAGLDRVMAAIIPYTAVLCMYTVDRISKSSVAVLFCVFFIVMYPFDWYSFPLKATSEEKASMEAAAWLKENRKDNRVVYYAHPAIIFYAGLNPFEKTLNRECFDYYKECDVEKDKSFYYFWDSAFSEFACGHPISVIEKCSGMRRIKEFNDSGFKIYVYEFVPGKLMTLHDHNL